MPNPRKPNNILDMHGARRKHRHGEKGSELQVTEKIGRAPAWLSAGAKKEWARITKIMNKYDVFRVTDLQVLIMYCVRASAFNENPESFKAGDIAQLRFLCNELGLTPVSRSKLPGTTKNKSDEFSDF